MFQLFKQYEGNESYCLLQLARKDVFETIQDLVLYLNLSEDVVVELIELKEIPFDETPTGKRFKREALDQWLLEDHRKSGLEELVDFKLAEISLLEEKYYHQGRKLDELRKEFDQLAGRQRFLKFLIANIVFGNFILVILYAYLILC